MTAVKYQSMPPLSPQEYSDLRADIEKGGVEVPIIVDEAGVIIDGHHRQAVADELGISCPRVVREGLSETEKRTMAFSLNLNRRHLTQAQRRALIEESLKADPELSDRQHAQRTGASHPSVSDRRRDMVARGALEDSTNAKTKDGRSYPRERRSNPRQASPVTEAPELIREVFDLTNRAGDIAEKLSTRKLRKCADNLPEWSRYLAKNISTLEDLLERIKEAKDG